MRKEFLPYCQPLIGHEEITEVVDSLKSGWLTMGPKTIEFENLISEYTGAKYSIAVNSCTAALHLSLIACGIGSHDEVITTPYTFASTGNVIVQVGAKPVFVDVKRDTYNIDPNRIEEAITPNTKAIIPVHFGGQPCDMNAIMKIADERGLFVIEDAAHALGAEYYDKKIGCIGDSTCFSFYPTKNMTTGEGGAITTNDDKLADKLRTLRLHGISKDAWKRYSSKGNWYYEIEDCGWKYNMTDIQAAIGIPQIKKLDSFYEIRKRYANIYTKNLCKIEGVNTPNETPDIKHVYHLYPILLENYDRAKFIEEMGKRNIACSVHFIPLHLHPFYKNQFNFKKGDYPNAEWLYEHEVSLPLYPKMSIEDVKYVIENVEEILC